MANTRKSRKSTAAGKARLVAAAARRAAARRRAQPKRTVRRQAALPMHKSIVDALDARVVAHVAPPMPGTAYTVLRYKDFFTISQQAATDTIAVFGSFVSDDANYGRCQANVLGFNVLGTTVPPNVANWYQSGFATAGSLGALDASLHALTVTVRSFATATTAEGDFYLGTLPNRPDRAQYSADYTAFASTLKARPQMRHMSMYEATISPRSVTTCPLDVTDWSTLLPLDCPIISGSPGDIKTSDRLTPIYLVIPARTATKVFAIDVYSEWRVIANADATLASTAALRSPPPSGFWNTAARLISTYGGHILDAGVGYAAARGGLGRLVPVGGAMIERALPMMGGFALA